MNGAYTVLPDYPQDSPEWHAARADGIGASEVAAVLGLSRWGTPLEVYRAKKGVIRDIPEHLSYFGHALEPVIAGWVTRTYPDIGYVGSGFSARSVRAPWLTASPDRIITDRDHNGPVPLELKTADAFTAKAWEDGVPLGYQAQVQTQMFVLGARWGYLAVLHGGNRPDIHRLDRDDAFIDDILLPVTERFWNDHVLADVPPDPVTTAEAVSLWPGDPDLAVDGDEALYELWEEYGRQQAIAIEAEATLNVVKLELQKAMREATTLTYEGRPLFTWKPRKGSATLDVVALRRDHPEIAEAYTRTAAATRVFKRVPSREVVRS